MNKPKKNSIINKSLEYLKETSTDLFNLSAKIIFDPKELLKGMSIYKDYNENSYYKNIWYLKRSSYFTTKNNKIYLNAKGRIKIIKDIIKESNKTKKWDNRWIAVIFDVPETNRRERNFLRRELKLLGFKELQQSIWVFPFNIQRELLILLKLWKNDFYGDIRILIIDKIIEDEDFKEKFNL